MLDRRNTSRVKNPSWRFNSRDANADKYHEPKWQYRTRE